ncbi:MAG TPA: hypothetical protein VHA52_01820 [Candidatus Babeliaceae bacterium]|nr:hypothetical protein [Candidatus Babeliaceae bacterium]HVZ97876.1 hypothetical protein [Chitinophagaceae bacterium]
MIKKQIIVNQFLHETETWKRTLGFIEEENVILKNRLSEMLKYIDTDDTILIEKLEVFQDLFVSEDESIHQLKKQINEEDKLLLRDTYEDGDLFRRLLKKQKKLRKQFEAIDKRFNRIRNDFNQYLSEVYA